MELKQLEAFYYVVKLGSFSKAAEMIFLSQPTISSQINVLEKELGTQLLVRSTREVYPTKTGKVIFEYAQSMLALRDKAINSVNKFSSDTVGEIEILASSVPSQFLLPRAISNFITNYPNITFRVFQTDSKNVVKDISASKFDFGISGTQYETNINKCLFENFLSDRLVMIVPNSSKYRDSDLRNNLERFIMNEKFIMREFGSGTRLEYEAFLINIGINPRKLNVVAYFNNTQSILESVSSNMGISFVSSFAADSYVKRRLIIPIEIDNGFLQRNFCFVYKKDMILSPIAELLINFLKTYFREEH